MQLPHPRACREDFARHGFVIVHNALRGAECDAVVNTATDLLVHARTVTKGSDEDTLSYAVVTGDSIRSQGPALFELYTAPTVISWVQSVTGDAAVATSPHIRSAININCLSVAGQRYPWHRDAVPYTALLFLSSLSASDGGEFLIESLCGDRFSVRPARGLFVLLDGSRCPHAVADLRTNTTRLSIPMVFAAKAQPRPDGLDDWLYVPSCSPACHDG